MAGSVHAARRTNTLSTWADSRMIARGTRVLGIALDPSRSRFQIAGTKRDSETTDKRQVKKKESEPMPSGGLRPRTKFVGGGDVFRPRLKRLTSRRRDLSRRPIHPLLLPGLNLRQLPCCQSSPSRLLEGETPCRAVKLEPLSPALEKSRVQSCTQKERSRNRGC